MDKSATLTWLRRISGDIASVTIKRLEDTLPSVSYTHLTLPTNREV